MKSLLKLILPPVVVTLLKKVRDLVVPRKELLFDGDEAQFKQHLSGCSVYGEYGCGQSTLWVLANTSAVVYSVESSPDWIAKVRNEAEAGEKLQIHHADMGEIGDWGHPVDYTKRDNYSDYTNWIWEQDQLPDVVLIDGRFRVACFLTSLLRAKEGTTIIFDDYVGRPQYHIVEEFVKVAETDGRQAVFTLPAVSDEERTKVEDLLERFRLVKE